jgi:hypothetical protein
VVCGRRRERHPQRSIFNRMCDIEWDTAIGDTTECGGDALIRLHALDEVGGYDPSLIAGEEPELCVRLRRRGHVIERLAVEMTLHDAAMTKVGQWWRRRVRAGHACAEGVALHGAAPERHGIAPYRRTIFWALGVPALALALAPLGTGAILIPLLGYPLSAARVYRQMRSKGRSRADAAIAGTLMTLGKFPELAGIVTYHWTRSRGRRAGLIEYKRRGKGV